MPEGRRRQFTDRRLFIAGACVVSAWTAVVLSVPGITAVGLFRYVAGFLLLVLLPAALVVRQVFPALDWFERGAIAAPLGIAAVTVLFWILQLAGLDILTIPLAAALGLVGIVEIVSVVRVKPAGRNAPAHRAPWIALSLVACAAAILGAGGFFVAVRGLPDGSLLYRDVPFDTRFHVVIASELLRGVPPQTPYFPGYPLNYHYFFDLFTVVMHRLSGIPLFPLIACLQFSLFLVTFVVSAAAFVAALTGSTFATAAASALMLFGGSPFNVIVGPVFLGGGRAWEHSFHGQSAMPLFTVNPQGIGLALVFAAFLAAVRSAPGRPLPGALVAGFLFGAACAFKMFAGLLAIGAMAVAGLIGRIRRLPSRWPVLIAAMVFGTVTATYFLALNSRAGQLAVDVKPGWFVLFGLDYLGLSHLRDYASAVYDGERQDVMAIAAGIGLIAVLLIGNLGYRLPALRRLAEGLFDRSFERRTMAVMFWTGLAIFVFVQLKPVDWPNYYNNAGWFNHVGLTLSAVFVAEHWARARAAGRRLLPLLYATLSLAAVLSMAQFFVVTAYLQPTHVSRDDADALAFLREHTDPASVVLVHANPYTGGYANVEMLAERRVYLGADWAHASVRKSISDTRVHAVETFFTHPQAGADLLQDGIAYVWVDNVRDAVVNRTIGGTACSEPGVRSHSMPLACVFRNQRFTIYRVIHGGT